MANLGARSPVGQIRENSGAAAKYVPPETRARHAVKNQNKSKREFIKTKRKEAVVKKQSSFYMLSLTAETRVCACVCLLFIYAACNQVKCYVWEEGKRTHTHTHTTDKFPTTQSILSYVNARMV